MSAAKRKVRKLRFQRLEDRQLMAGDVSLSVADGMLHVTGDKAGNGVEIAQVGDGYYAVKGVYQAGAETRVNGTTHEVVVKGVESINVSLNGGDDNILLKGLGDPNMALHRDMDIATGDGNDEVNVRDMWIVGNGSISTDVEKSKVAGNDIVGVHQMVLYGSLDVATFGGSDTIEFTTNPTTDGGGLYWNSAFEGYRIDSGAGTAEGDSLGLEHLFTWKGIDIVTGEGKDTIHAKTLLAYEGDVSIRTGGSADTITFANVEGWNMAWQLTEYDTSVIIDTGAGNDTVVLTNIDVRGSVIVQTGAGADNVSIHGSDAGQLIVADLGSGDDSLLLANCTAKVAELYGGSHYKADTLEEVGNTFDQIFRNGWEAGSW